jgi:glycosyltransferase involved in cell wall biosynthesis
VKVVQVTPYFAPVEGGVERHVLNLSKELIKLGHEVEVLTCNLTRKGQVLDHSSIVEGIQVRRFPVLATLGEFGRAWPGFGLELLRGKFDIVHVHAFRHPHTDLAAVLSRLSRRGSVMTPHSSFYPLDLRRPLARGLVQIYDTLIAPVSLMWFDRLVSLTKVEARTLQSLGARRAQIVVIANGVEEEHFSKGEPGGFKTRYGLEGCEVILYLGRINRSKGINVLLESFEEVARVRPNARLVLAGPATSSDEEAFKATLLTRAATLEAGGSVIFTGALSEDEKRAAYEACDVFVLPSIYEGYGLVLLEAGAHGKPVISTLTHGPSSVVTDGFNGFLVQPRNALQLAETILRVLEDRSLRVTLGERARATAREHTWNKVALQTEAVYEEIN